jgi:hypothetical protein
MKNRIVDLKPAGAPAIKYLAFSGLPDFASVARDTGDRGASVSWAGATFSETVKRALTGDLSRVPASDAMLAQMESLLDLSGLRSVTVPAVAGGVPCVPAVLAGHPLAMRQRKRVTHDRGEVVLFVDAWTSSSASAESIARRGAAVLALARALSAVRPVRIVSWALSGSTKTSAFLYSLPLESSPVDLARAAWIFSAPEFTRQARLAIQERVLGHDTCARIDFDPLPLLCDLLSVAPGSAVNVAGLSSVSADFDRDAGAVAWVQNHLQRLTA